MDFSWSVGSCFDFWFFGGAVDDDDNDDDVDDEDDAVDDGRLTDKASLEHSGIRNSLKTKKS